MFHMLSCFDLDPGIKIETFRADYLKFFAEMKSIGLVESTGPVGRRQNDTRMDTDIERHQEFFVIMSFRDRKQVDAAYAHIQADREPGDSIHTAMCSNVRNPIFICWEDVE